MTQFNFKLDRENQRLVISSDEEGQAKIFYDLFYRVAQKTKFGNKMEFNEQTEEIYVDSSDVHSEQLELVSSKYDRISVNLVTEGVHINDHSVDVIFASSQLRDLFCLYFSQLKETSTQLSNGLILFFPEPDSTLSFELAEFTRAELNNIVLMDLDFILIKAVKDLCIAIRDGICDAFQFMKDWFVNLMTNIGFFSPASTETELSLFSTSLEEDYGDVSPR